MAYGEFCSGVVTNEKNVLFINFDYGIGLGVMINGELYYGKSGFAGEFGHIPFFQNELICHCGKRLPGNGSVGQSIAGTIHSK